MIELRTIARPYAKAIFKSGLEQKKLDQWDFLLSSLSGVLKEPRIIQAIGVQGKTVKQRVALLESVLGRSFLLEEVNLLVLLDGKKRLALLPAIQELFHDYVLAEEQIVAVDVESALPLANYDIESLTSTLSAYFKQQVVVTVCENKELIGGIIIRAMDQVIDMSILGRLNKLKQAMSVG